MKGGMRLFTSTLLFAFSACGQVNDANLHLASLDQTSKNMQNELTESRKALQTATDQSVRIADALVAFQKMGVDLVSTFQQSAQNTKPTVTENIDDILKKP